MGQLNGSTGNNNIPDVIINKYLNLAGLTSFWTKAKQYITNSQDAQTTAITNAYTAEDNGIRNFIGTLSINGHKLAKYTAGAANAAGTLTLEDDLMIDSADVPLTDAAKAALVAGNVVAVGGNGAAYGDATTVDAGLIQLDTRMDAVETAFKQGVVNNLTTTVTHASYTGGNDYPVEGEKTAKAWVKVTENAKAVGEVSVNIDDTEINTKMTSIDQEIATLQANAGVVGIKVVDSPTKDASASDNYVKFTMTPTGVNGGGHNATVDKEGVGAGYSKGYIELTVDETALDNKITTITTDLTDEVTDRKADVVLLAGNRGAIGENGKFAWDDTKWTGDVKYNNISAIAQRLETIDSSVVTKVTVEDVPGTGTDADLITFTSDKDDTGTGDIKLTLNHSQLNQRIQAIDTLDAEFAKYSVNGKPLFTKSSGDNVSPVTGAATAVVLTGADINRDASEGAATIAQTFTTLEGKIAALASATEFKGVVSWDPTNVTITQSGVDAAGVAQYKITGDNVSGEVIMQNGDIVITGGTDSLNKEYILDAANNRFFELGDTTSEQTQLTEIQTWINTPISESEIAALFA